MPANPDFAALAARAEAGGDATLSAPWPDDETGPVSLLSRAGRSRLRMLEAMAEKNPAHAR